MPSKKANRPNASGVYIVFDDGEEEILGSGNSVTAALKDAEERADADCKTLDSGQLFLAKDTNRVETDTTIKLKTGAIIK